MFSKFLRGSVLVVASAVRRARSAACAGRTRGRACTLCTGCGPHRNLRSRTGIRCSIPTPGCIPPSRRCRWWRWSTGSTSPPPCHTAPGGAEGRELATAERLRATSTKSLGSHARRTGTHTVTLHSPAQPQPRRACAHPRAGFGRRHKLLQPAGAALGCVEVAGIAGVGGIHLLALQAQRAQQACWLQGASVG